MARPAYTPAVGPRLRRLLTVIFAFVALIAVNSFYLLVLRWAGAEYQGWFFLLMFLGHLGLGLALVLPVILFAALHIRTARHRPNRRAIRAGYGLFASALVLFASGIVLTRVDLPGFRLDVSDPTLRRIGYWIHVLAPVAAAWLFILHRLAGHPIRWKVGGAWGVAAVVFAGAMLLVQAQDPRAWNQAGPASGDRYFRPSLSRTSSGEFIPERVLRNDAYCRECHEDVHDSWGHSAHRFASFNNPAYLFSVRETRRVLHERDGSVQAARFCAGCHDPVPFFSGAFDDPRFDDPDYDLAQDPSAQAGITCTACHAISHVNSPRGNGDYTIDEPVHYPFTFSANPALRWLNRQLVKAKPEFHKATFLKPLHQTAEFCGACHKVHLPEELNDYKWLRGQNHYDSFLLSGVSGHGVQSFYYPDEAEQNCNGCHMPIVEVGAGVNFSARVRDDSGVAKTLDHLFPSANTAMPALVGDRMRDPAAAIAAHEAFTRDTVRVDIFGLRDGAAIDGPLTAPLRPDVPTLQPGRAYLLEIVIRTLELGHLLTEGTADSNELWLDVAVLDGDRVVSRSGGRDERGTVDPWAHFVNAFVLDRTGNRIDRRNAEDIFVPLYNHQIPPGAADAVHYRLAVPNDAGPRLTVRVALRYRKFDTAYHALVVGDPEAANPLPIMTIAEDELEFRVGSEALPTKTAPSPIPEWQRWNDYGIGLLRKGERGQLRQAGAAFARVEALGRADGPLNLARVHIKEGLVQTHAPDALGRAAAMEPPAPAWSLRWFGAVVAKQNGDYDRAIADLRDILRGGFAQARGRGFDFSRDYRLLVELGGALYQRGLQEGGQTRADSMRDAAAQYERALEIDPENLAAHWGLKQVFADLGDLDRSAHHAAQHAGYKPDDNARDAAVAAARRRYPAANHAAEDVVIYDLRRAEPDGLAATPESDAETGHDR